MCPNVLTLACMPDTFCIVSYFCTYLFHTSPALPWGSLPTDLKVDSQSSELFGIVQRMEEEMPELVRVPLIKMLCSFIFLHASIMTTQQNQKSGLLIPFKRS
jgi:hypothetical protein